MPHHHRTPPADRIGPAAIAAWLALILAGEVARPLRRRRWPKLRRNARNALFAAGSTALVGVAQRPVVDPLCRRVDRDGLGLLPALGLPRAAETALALALMDLTLYHWHVLTHKVPALWRFHLVHHSDLDLDATTALRFHFGELLVSIPWRAAQVRLIGVRPDAFRLWQRWLLLSVLFHHSNLRLPDRLERALGAVIVTPRMHGIHHSVVREETDSNWSSGLTVWDWLHGTLRLDVPQDRIDIGVPGWRDPAELTLPRLLALPFRHQRPSWRMPPGAAGAGRRPARTDPDEPYRLR